MANHPIVHVEIPANDVQAMGKFYSSVFDWKLNLDTQFSYLMFQAEGGPGGGFVQLGGPETEGYEPGRVLVYVGTDDIPATLAAVEAQGGQTVMPKTEIPGTGWFAIFTDPTGNRIGLFSRQ